MVPTISHLVEQFYAFLFTNNSMESSENAPSTLANKDTKEELRKFETYYYKVMLAYCLPKFDGLWCIILKLLTKKGDRVTSQDAVRITVIT